MPVSALNARAKWRWLIAARAARAATDRAASRWAALHACRQLAQRRALGRLAGELGAELRLAARPLDEQHEPARHLERDARAEVLLDEREREVHPARHRGPP